MTNNYSDTISGNDSARSYDEVPYLSYPFYETCPAHLQVIGRIFGFSAAPLYSCSVLELGCSAGNNLIPLAYRYPNSTFVGIDISGRAVEQGGLFVQELHLGNIQLIKLDIREWADHFSQDTSFDYIIAHGVLSWVAEDVQDEIFHLMRQLLTPQGIAYLSYNTYPGWHSRAFMRVLLRFHTEPFPDPATKLRECKLITRACSQALKGAEYHLAMHTKEMLSSINSLPEWYLYHDLLEEHNTPFYLLDVIDKAREFGFQYLGDADSSVMVDFGLSEEVQKFVRSSSKSDIGVFEQYLDFFANRMLRRSLFVSSKAVLNRALGPEEIPKFHLALPYFGESIPKVFGDGASSPYTLLTPKGVLETSDSVMALAFQILANSWPYTVSFNDLKIAVMREHSGGTTRAKLLEVDVEANLAINLFRALMRGFVRARLTPVYGDMKDCNRIKYSSHTRKEAACLSRVTTIWHEHVDLTGEESLVVQHCDGTMTLEEIKSYLLNKLGLDVQVRKITDYLRRRGVTE